MIKKYNFHSTRLLILFFELAIAAFSFCFSVFIFKNRLQFELKDLFITLLFVLSFRLLSFWIFKSYLTVLRYTSYKDIFRIFISITSSSFIFFFINNIAKAYILKYTTSNFVILFDYLLSLLFIIGYRLVIRYSIEKSAFNNSELEIKKIAIIGTNNQSILTKHYLDYERDKYKYKVVAYFTIDNALVGKQIESEAVYHISKISSLIEILNISTIVVVESTDYKQYIDSISSLCEKKNIQIVENQNLKQWVSYSAKSISPKNLRIEDLLQRESIKLDLKNISNQLKDKTIVVSGAAGSIGSELCKQILRFDPKLLILIDQAESPLYDIENQLIINYSDKIKSYIASVYDLKRIETIFNTHRPDLILHAAAYKHVPLMENNPYEAIKTNLLGTINMADLAIKYNVAKFIFISTDKAVNPTNVMGATKRAAEIYIQSKNSLNTKFITTRFGNVLGSNGSVIPIFRKQIENGGPIMVTHPEITRFFMTIPEACQLVLEAGSIGNGGEIYIFDMGESVKIVDLAKNMIKMYGLTEEDIKIEFSGLRPGEKLYEELLANKENTLPTHNQKIMIAKISPNNEENITKIFNELKVSIDNMNENIQLVSSLKQLIPEYVSNNSEFEILDKK